VLSASPFTLRNPQVDRAITHLHPQPSSLVLLTTSTWLQKLILAKASPLNPYVTRLWRSSNFLSLEVAYLVHSSGRSARLIPWPLSVIWMSLRPPSFRVSLMEVEPASSEFSMSSLIALDGRCMICYVRQMLGATLRTSAAAILFTTSSDSLTMVLDKLVPSEGSDMTPCG
jgi:hypothetical protein